MNNTTCPLCESKKNTKTNSFTVLDSAKHIVDNDQTLLNEMSEYIAKNISMGKTINFCRCNDCDLEFADPFKAADSHIYNILYRESSINQNFWKWDFEVAFQYLQEQKNTTDKNTKLSILDIGAGSGHFLKKIKTTYSNSECHAVEYSENCRNELEKLEIKTHHELESILKNKKDISFDYICLFQVLEHIDDFDNLFKKLKQLLNKEGGRIIITTPNSFQRKYYDSLDIFEDVPPIHISRFNKGSFAKISEKYNLELLEFNIERGSFLRNCIRFMNTKYKNNPIISKVKKLSLGRYLVLIIYTPMLFLNLKTIIGLNKKNMGTSQIAIFMATN